MLKMDVRVLGGTYSTETNRVVVILFGVNNEGDSVTVRYKGFNPYFYIVEPRDWVVDELRDDPNVLDLKTIKLLIKNSPRQCIKVTITKPFEVTKYRTRYGHEHRFMAADIIFLHRFYYDLDLTSCVKVIGNEAPDNISKKFRTRWVLDAEDLVPIRPFKPPLKVLSFDIENSIQDQTIYCICCAYRKGEQFHYKAFEGEEIDLLNDFTNFIIDFDPDVITGYNIDNYDIPWIIKRRKVNHLGKWLLSRDGSEIKSRGRFWRCLGRLVADAWWHVKQERKPQNETLNYVSKKYLGEGKHDVNPKEMDREWLENPARVIKYCKKDAELALRLLENLNILDRYQDLATVSKLPLEDVLNGRTSQLIDSILIREVDKHKIGVPMTHHSGRSDKIEGGYVHQVEPGLYHWVCVLDFQSMYPSTIISNNICFTTLSREGTIVAPNGIKFLDPDEKKGIIPRILKQLMENRAKAKLRMKEYEGDQYMVDYYDGLQYAIKILMNSFYGVLASNFYRFTDKDIGAAITAFSRENIKNIIQLLTDENINVLYSDTDSIFFQSPFDNLEKSLEFGNQLANRFSQHGAVLEFEKVLEPFFTHGVKKRYVGTVLWPEKDLLVRGYEIRRSDSFDLLTDGLKGLFNKILSGHTEECVGYVRNLVSKTLDGEIEKEKLIISKSVKNESSYKNPGRMPAVLAKRKMEALGYNFVPGMKVPFIVTDAQQTPQEVEPVMDSDNIDVEPDWEYYAGRIARAFGRVTEVFGWSDKDLLETMKQTKLFSDDFVSSSIPGDFGLKPSEAQVNPVPVNEKKEDPSKKKKVTLMDFM